MVHFFGAWRSWKEKEVLAVCSCGLEHPLNYVQSFEPVDYFNKLIDGFNKT
jgi:transcription elongation factor Elf1